jgi:hypothetical protein
MVPMGAKQMSNETQPDSPAVTPTSVLSYSSTNQPRRYKVQRRLGVLSVIAAIVSVIGYAMLASSAWANYREDRLMAGTPVIDLWYSATHAVAALGSVAAAILLAVAGVKTFRQHPVGLRLHRLYLWIQVPMAALAALAEGVSWGTARAERMDLGLVALSTMLPLLVGGAYPLMVMMVLRSRALRNA